MDFDGSFTLIGRQPTDSLRAKVEALTADDWLEAAWQLPVSTHTLSAPSPRSGGATLRA
jgi:hypothetical protein